ncbi:MAG TPA: SdrD B-like domain-containing protein [Thermoanaerobaculia bacterium]|nr:SdrD B-like domain-containing protein [Thermoanaerobaculia bacterium]
MSVVLLGLLWLPLGAGKAFAQAEEPRPQLEEILYQDLLDSLEAEETEPTAAASSTVSPMVAKSPRRSLTAAATGPVLRCLPTCNSADGRMLAIAGQNAATLSGSDLIMQIAVPAGSTSFTVGFFDGDSRSVDSAGISHWDGGVTTAIYEYTLYADPTAEGIGTTVMEIVPGFPVLTGSMMPDNAWIDFTVPTSPLALTPGGNYFYRLRVRLATPTLTTLNAFKVRTSAVLSGLTLDPAARPFSYIVNPSNQSDLRILYPSFPAATPTTYDGTFSFFFEVPASREELTLWDGDFDYGKFDGSTRDTDDPNTANAPFRPSWSTIDTVSEGVAVGLNGSSGNPADDRNSAGSGVYSVRAPSIRYDLYFPNGQVFPNDNPSGNQEWERFTVSTDPFDATQMDYSAPAIPPGVYELRANGVDLVNLNALLLPFKLICVDELGVPCTPLRPFAIGDTVFFDTDADQTQDAGEAGIPGVVVELRDTRGYLLGTATTDASGNYRFGVDAGTHQVVVATSNFNAGGPLEGTIATIAHQLTRTVTNDNVFTYDFGFRGNGSLGDRVWLDRDADGAQDAGEAGIGGVTVELRDGSGNVVGTTTTDADGLYSFDHLTSGSYTVRVDASTLPAGVVPSFDLDGTASANTATAALAGGANRTDVDFGYRGTAALGDRVWYDIDGDGAQDPVESGLAGVTVQLVDDGGNVIATTVTNADGEYAFVDLVAGSYTVRVAASTLPGEAAPTYDLDGIATPDAAVATLDAGQTRTDVDFGYRGTAALGDRVWYDIDGNGTQDAGEVGINGVTVELLDGSGDVLLSTVTAGDGGYTFAGLLPGTYNVRVVSSTLPGGAVATYDLDGTDTPHLATATVASGQNLSTVDFGYRGTASLGDRVWFDLNSNGAQDSGEAGLSGVAVELVDGSGNVLAAGATTSTGLYGFSNLLAGSYTVRVVSTTLPGGLVQTYDLDGTATANTASLTLAAGAARTDVDFGYRGTLQFGDRVWFDNDGNGVQDTGEPGLPSVTIELRDSSGTLISTTITGANGNYTFYNLTPGSYTVTIVTSTLPAGSAPTYDYDGIATPHTTAVTLASGQSRTDIDFGYRGTASLGDRVWLDYDADGVQDAGEVGLNGVTVQLLDTSNNVIASATTAGDGNYTFPNLLAGTYKVRVVTSTLMSGAIQTYDLDGTGTAHVATVAVAAGQARTDADFGYRVAAPGTGTIGYWKNHPQAWPVSTITIGGVVYTRDQAIVLIGTPSRGDKSIDLFKQLVASKLSVMVGNNPSCIYQTINAADAWLATYPPGSNVGSSSSAWTQASPWHTQLDNYNNGGLCAPHRN